MVCYSTQSEIARHDSRAHVQQLTIFSTTPACFARHATRDVNITVEEPSFTLLCSPTCNPFGKGMIVSSRLALTINLLY